MNRARSKLPIRWITGLIVFAALGVIALFLVDRSPTRTLQRLGFSDEAISKIRHRAKRTHYIWSIDDKHPSYFRATFGSDTNHVVPNEVANNIRDFVYQTATESSYPRDYIYLRECGFGSYGSSQVLQMPDNKLLYVYMMSKYNYFDTHFLQVYVPSTKTTCSIPTVIDGRNFSTNEIVLVPHDDKSLFTIRHLRSDQEFELGIRSTFHYGTDSFGRDYTYYLIDDELNLRPILSHRQEFLAGPKIIFSDIESINASELKVRYIARERWNAKKHHEVGFRHYRWNNSLLRYERTESKLHYESSDLDWAVHNWLMPELAPTNPPPATTSNQPTSPKIGVFHN